MLKPSTMLHNASFIVLCFTATVAFHNAIAPHIPLVLVRVVRVAVIVSLLQYRTREYRTSVTANHKLPHIHYQPSRFHHFVVSLMLLCASLLLSSAIGWLIFQQLPHTSATLYRGYPSLLHQHTSIALTLLTAVLGAADEELLFRVLCHHMWRTISHTSPSPQSPAPAHHRHKPTAFIVCSTALFTAAHIGLPLPTVLHALGASVVLSAFYVRSRSTPLTILLHAAVNAIAITLYYFSIVLP